MTSGWLAVCGDSWGALVGKKPAVHGVLFGWCWQVAEGLDPWSYGLSRVPLAVLPVCIMQQEPGKIKGISENQKVSFLQCPFSVLF